MKPLLLAIVAVMLVGCAQPSDELTADMGAVDVTSNAVDMPNGQSDQGVGGDDVTTQPDVGPGMDSSMPDLPPDPPVGSAGCGNQNPPTGARQLAVQGEMGDFIVSIPASYDPETPYPLGFGFHGANRTHENCQAGDCRGFQEAMQDEAILVYMKSFSANWTQMPERDQNAEFFELTLDTMLAEYCVDASTVFVAGTSSGASFSNILACRFGDRLLATVPVAGGLSERDDCVGTLAALVVHGVDDYHVPFDAGETARDFYLERNGCTQMAEPPVAELHDRVVTNRETYECADYQGCDGGLPVRWCEHSEGGYDGSTHGWPTFGGTEIWAFVQSLRQ